MRNADPRPDLLEQPPIDTRIVQLPGGPAEIAGYPTDPYFQAVEQHAKDMFTLANLAWQHAGPGLVLDVGGNIGLSCISLARACPRSRIMVFEPAPRSAALIRRNLELNGVSDVEVHEVAVSDRPGRVRLNLTDNSGSSHVVTSSTIAPPGLPAEVDSVVLDDLVHDRVGFIKLDIEGHEPNALAGMARLIEAASPLILMEFNAWCLNAFGGHSPAAFARALWDRFEVSAVGVDGFMDRLADDPLEFIYRSLVQHAHQDVAMRLRPGACVPGVEHLSLPKRIADELVAARRSRRAEAEHPLRLTSAA